MQTRFVVEYGLYVHRNTKCVVYAHCLKGTTRSKVVILVNIFQAEKAIEIQLVRPTEVYGKV